MIDDIERSSSVRDLLDSEIALLEALEETIAREKAAIVERDAEKIVALSDRKLQQIRGLEALEQQRRVLAPTIDGGCFETGIVERWSRVLALTSACKEGNRENKTLVGAQLGFLQNLLALLRGEATAPGAYASDGSAPRQPRRSLPIASV